MANHEDDGSLAQELWKTIDPFAYRGIVPYIGKNTAVKLKDFEQHDLNERYWLDTRNCKQGKKINRQQIFELFSAYSGELASDVREGMLVKIMLEKNFYRVARHVILGKSTIDTWMKKMSKMEVPGDELAIFALSRFYSRHTIIYTSIRPWTTLAPEHFNSIDEAHNRCQTHLVYLGQNMYGVLRPRPFENVEAPLSVDEVLNPMRLQQTNYPQQQEPLNLSVLPHDDYEIASDPTVCSKAASDTETSIKEGLDADDLEVPEVGAETTVNQTDSDHSSLEITTTPPTPTPPTGPSIALCHAVEDARNKHYRVKLVLLTNAELEKYLNMKPDNDIKIDNSDNVSADIESVPKRSAINPTNRHRVPVNYAESSISDGGSIHSDTTDSDLEVEHENPKRRKAVSRHGPSLPRMAAQRIISDSKLTANQKDKTDCDQKSSSGSSRSHSPEMTQDLINRRLPSKPKRKRKGELLIQTYGIKKARQNRIFRCKECEYKSYSIKLLNEHHIEEHDPVPCTECGHISATPSSHDQHFYKHKERKFSCDNCEQTFAFKSELNAHKYSHRNDRSFKCMASNCAKTFK